MEGLRVYERFAYRGGEELPATIRYWRVEYPFCIVSVTVNGREWSARAHDAFAALADVRTQLEPEGYALGVEGSRLGNYPSGMQRDQGDGLFVYRLTRGLQTVQEDSRETFDAVDNSMLASVEQQRFYYEGWLVSLRHRPLAVTFGPLAMTVREDASVGYTLSDGEMRWSMSRGNVPDHWILSCAMRGNPFRFEFEASTFDDARRFLMMSFGNDVRSHLSLDALSLDSARCAPDYYVETRGDRDLLLNDGRQRGIFARSSGQRRANQYSWLVDHPLDDLIASYQAADGMPLLACFVRQSP